jgi:hypothetical protein
MSKLNFKKGPRYKFRDQHFWAEGGMICIENQNNGDFKVITRMEAAARAITLNDELPHMAYADERDELCKCVVELCEAIKEGKRQGDPMNPEVRKQRIRDSRKVSLLMGPGPSSLDLLGKSTVPGIGSGTIISSAPKPTSDRFKRLML